MIYIRISLCVTPGTPPVVAAPLGGDQSVSRILKLSTHRLSLALSSGHDDVLAVRAVETEDFMTADWSHLPYEMLARISTRVINEVRGINRVVYDISSKPPATIEWE